MTERELLQAVDHTLLKQTATWEQIREICEDAMRFQTASVCIPPSFVRQASEYLGGRCAVCTVIGFPNGYCTTAVKVFETEDAVRNGADEIDMVINLGWVKEKEYGRILDEINQVKKACGGRILKVIIETCLLNEEEKIRLCRTVTGSEADFIKTSTGFSEAGATFEDVALMKAYMGNGKKIKAAGGIRDFADGEKFLTLGADRLGTSRLVSEARRKEGPHAKV
ncbi:MAG: deoxyribose-phosphate aldolase [Lachnospiraceae bacterium]|jgi:deoxyribose-phosphate aldolase|nr:deoxyribose-phosphate aldolase [Lachnospiraceae bacterium]NBJ81323.1 deoxyribose-phosphate aldolase [bacterium 1XD42-76]NBK04766.1 deoxyribose-phosphate aldolase [bacterium 1XD42-94]